MISRNDIISTLEKMKTKENSEKIEGYINRINELDDDALQMKLKDNGIKSKLHLKRFIKKDLKRQKETKFTELNELVSYGTRGKTLHIHVVPKDLHSMLNREGLKRGELELIDALEKIQAKLKTDKKLKNIDQVFAVSGLIARPVSRLFDNLDFDVKSVRAEQAKEDPELKRFYEMFKENKHIGRAQLSKEKLLSDEWNDLKESRKKTLQYELSNKFENELSTKVNSKDETYKYDVSHDEQEKTKITEVKTQEKY